MKKLLIYVLVVFTAFSLFSGCEPADNREPLSLTTEEAREILGGLVPLSLELNEVFFGKGLPTADPDAADSEESGAEYYEVSPDAAYKSIAEIKADAEKVYSSAYLSHVYIIAFEGAKTDYGTENEDGEAAYTEYIDPRYKEEDGVLMIDVAYAGYELNNTPLTDTAEVVECTPDYVKVSVKYSADGAEAGTMNILLAYENGQWRLDSPTY